MDVLCERKKIKELKNEKKLIVLLSRLTFSNNVLKEISFILQDEDFNWFEFYQYALYHKVLTLCWKNINTFFLNAFQPKYARDMIQSAYLGVIKRNQLYQEEISKIVFELNEKGVKIVPVKGAYLIPKIYKDYGMRYSGDVDFLIKYVDLNKAEKILEHMGYLKGEYSWENKNIVKISRREQIKWKTFMSNSYPLLKLTDTDLFPVYKIDFRFALSDDLRKETVNEIIDNYAKSGCVKAAHYLIHLCTHFYDEAKHTADIALAKDMNLIKLCDIREYVIQMTKKEDLKELVCFAQKYGLEKQVYFTMVFLSIIYDDGYEEEILAQLNIENESFLYTIGDNTLKDIQRNDVSVAERLFACGKIKEQIATPKLYL